MAANRASGTGSSCHIEVHSRLSLAKNLLGILKVTNSEREREVDFLLKAAASLPSFTLGDLHFTDNNNN